MENRENSLRLGGGQKLIPKDISVALGKEPPQELLLEEAILAALMLESKAIDRVPFLKPDHFYLESHKEVFRAILFLSRSGSSPDFKMVISRLRESGKLEGVGGHFFVVELTTKASSAENLETHTRVVIERAIKRSLILLAGTVHRDAYEDTDAFDLLNRIKLDIQHLEEKETTNKGPEKIKALWEKLRILNKPVRPETLIKFGDADVCTEGNISLLVGKKKSRKSLLVTLMLHIFLQSRMNVSDDLAVFDTEQEEYDVWASMERLYRMTNQMIPIFCLRGLSPKERRDFIEQTVTHWPRRLKIGVIDGIRDCMSNINDPDESTEVMSWLMRLNVQTKIHFINVLHLNKTDNNARGHIGSELLNKAEVTIEVELDPHSKDLYPPSIVKCESSRRKPFEPFMFTHGATGLPEIIGMQIGESAHAQDDQIKLLQQVFEDQTLKHPELKEQIRNYFGVGDTKAKQLIVKFVNKKWIMKSGKDRSPNTFYKLMISEGTVIPDPQSRIEYSDNPVPAASQNTDNQENELPF